MTKELWPCILISAFIVINVTAWDIHAKAVFIAIGYTRVHHHGKTFNRAWRHYFANWSFIQRVFWVPIFAEKYSTKYRLMPILSFIHWLLAVAIIFFVLADLFNITNINIANYSFEVFIFCFIFTPFTIGRFICTNAVARGKI